MADTPKKRKPGRPKGPCSDRELAQRRSAALKTGEHAATLERRLIPACKRRTCPLGDDGFPCELRERRDQAGQGTELCAPALLVDDAVRATFERAIATRDPALLAPLAAYPLAAMHALATGELARLGEEGFVLEQEILGKDGTKLGARAIENPRANPTLKLLALLGFTADDLAITPKSAGAADRDHGIADLAGFLRASHEALAKP